MPGDRMVKMAYIGVWFICGMLSLTSVSAANLYVRDVEQFEKYTPRLAPGDTLVLQSDGRKRRPDPVGVLFLSLAWLDLCIA